MKKEEVSLRRPVISDKVQITKLADNRKIADNLRDIFPYPYSEKDAADYINICMKEDVPVTFAIEFNGQLAGMIGLVPQNDVYRRTAEVGYWIGEIYWGRGIASKALELITKYGFDVLKFARLHTGVFENNKASMRVLEKNGYNFEGIFTKNIFKNGKFLDEYRYGKINVDIFPTD